MSGPAVVAIGGGHGLAVTLRACEPWAGRLTAIVSTADDGGSSGRIRSVTGLPAPGDIRRCLTALVEPKWMRLATALEERFGEPTGHPPGNLLLSALCHAHGGDMVAATAELAAFLHVPEHVQVLPAADRPVDLVARLDDGSVVRGQVAVEAAGSIDRVALDPLNAAPSPVALQAVADADLVVLGPGSLFGSVLAAAVVPGLTDAIAESPATVVFVCNLRAHVPETDGYDVAAHVAALRRHGIDPDRVVADPRGIAVGELAGPALVAEEVGRSDLAAHDPDRLGDALQSLLSGPPGAELGSNRTDTQLE